MNNPILLLSENILHQVFSFQQSAWDLSVSFILVALVNKVKSYRKKLSRVSKKQQINL